MISFNSGFKLKNQIQLANIIIETKGGKINCFRAELMTKLVTLLKAQKKSLII